MAMRSLPTENHLLAALPAAEFDHFAGHLEMVPMVSGPEHFWIVVAGGDGRHSAWMPAWNVCQGATQAVEL